MLCKLLNPSDYNKLISDKKKDVFSQQETYPPLITQVGSGHENKDLDLNTEPLNTK